MQKEVHTEINLMLELLTRGFYLHYKMDILFAVYIYGFTYDFTLFFLLSLFMPFRHKVDELNTL